MFVFETQSFENPKFIINFPTKRHWRGKSHLSDVRAGLQDLVAVTRNLGIRSIAIPPLGCGNGGLNWEDVRPLIVAAMAQLPDVQTFLYEPAGAPKAERMRISSKDPGLTVARAAILSLMRLYALPGYKLTMLEIQKLAYFLQVAGEPLKLDYVKQKYGPYAETLHHLLQRLEGHYIRGYGDRSRNVAVSLLLGAGERAEARLSEEHSTQERFLRVSELIEGFETPYGMELLATVHWVAANERPEAKLDPNEAVVGVHGWSEHKKLTFRPEHIRTAWQRLLDGGWF